jgi:alkylation response protein AidB-like acyl-CoA dehydrogenase
MTDSATAGSALTSDLAERARQLRPLLDEHAAAEDLRSELDEPVVEALHEGGFFGMWVPRSMGGTELWPMQSLEVLDELSYADASTGWVLMATALAIGTGAAYLADEAVDQVFGGERFPTIAGQGTKPGKAVPSDGGYLLSGDWSFASGIKHSGYIHTAAIVEGTGEPRIFVLPVEQATLIENWDVLGLRATGSIDYTIDSVFVPEEFSHFAVTEKPERGGDVYRLGIIGFACICHSGWALGVGRRLLDELRAMALQKSGRPGQLVDSDSFHAGYAKAEATYRSARAFLRETWSDIEQTLERGESLSVRQNTLARLALNHATWSVHEVCMFTYTSGGTTALRSGTIQRFFRDMHAGTQHVTSAPAILQACGRELAGLADGKRWVFLELVDAPA